MRKFKIKVNGEVYEVEVEEIDSSYRPASVVAPAPAPVSAAGAAPNPLAVPAAAAAPKPAAPAAGDGDGVIRAAMPGTILDVQVQVGDTVSVGQVLLVLEAMKMENELTAGKAGIIKEVQVTKGQAVQVGDVLIVID